MIDLRSHILDGVPCGPATFAESLFMAHSAVAAGVKTIVATPRWERDWTDFPISIEDCESKLRRLQTEMAGAVSIKLGFALQFSSHLPDLTRHFGSKLALGGKQHLLISLPSLSIPASTEAVWASLIKLGFSVLLAHPECNPAVRRDPARVARWIASGISLQLDAASVTGVHGRDVKRFALDCLRKFGDRVVLASNSRPGGHEVGRLKMACEEVSVKVGQLQAGKSFYLTPAEIIESNGPKNAIARTSSTRVVSNLLASLTLLKSFRGAQ